MAIVVRGTAQIKHATSHQVFDIEADELVWDVVSSHERDMGPDRLWSAQTSRDELGPLSWEVSEYPVGSLGEVAIDANGHEILANFDIQIEYPDADLDDNTDFDRAHAIEEMKDWFYENYEDPAQSLPYISREGGYQWINGGPVTPSEALQDNFTDEYPLEIIEEAAQSIAEERGLLDWSPVFGPDFYGEDDADDEFVINPALDIPEPEARDIVVERIAALEQLIRPLVNERLEDRNRPGIGHNQPPPEFDIFDVVSREEWREVQEAIAAIRAETERQQPAPEVLKRGQNVFVRALRRFGGWLRDRVNAGIDAGQAVLIGYGIAYPQTLFNTLTNAAQAVADWLHSLPLPF